MRKNNYFKEEIELLLAHKEQLQQPLNEWDRYAQIHQLPSSVWIKDLFGSWREMRKELGLKGEKNQRTKTTQPYRRVNQTKEEIAQVLLGHTEQIAKSKALWEGYSRERQLPTLFAIIKHFGSWKQMKQQLGIHNNYKKKFTKEQIIEIAKPYSNEIVTSTDWLKMSVKYQLPSYNTIQSTFGSWKNFAIAIGIKRYQPNNNEAQESRKIAILQQINQFQPIATTTAQWRIFAKENHLPSYCTILKYFGSWKQFNKEFKEFTLTSHRQPA